MCHELAAQQPAALVRTVGWVLMITASAADLVKWNCCCTRCSGLIVKPSRTIVPRPRRCGAQPMKAHQDRAHDHQKDACCSMCFRARTSVNVTIVVLGSHGKMEGRKGKNGTHRHHGDARVSVDLLRQKGSTEFAAGTISDHEQVTFLCGPICTRDLHWAPGPGCWLC